MILKNLTKKGDDWEVDTFRKVFPNVKITLGSIKRMLYFMIQRREMDAERVHFKETRIRPE